jgi:hypothetical protein
VGVLITTLIWVGVTFVTPASDEATLREFVRRVNPGGPGWRRVVASAAAAGAPIRPLYDATNIPRGLLCAFLGTVAVYAAVFAVGMFLYANLLAGVVLTGTAIASTLSLFAVWKGMAADQDLA